MLKPIIDFIIIIYERAGDLGLTFFLAIIVINLYNFWWWIPRKMQIPFMPFMNRLRTSQGILGIWIGIVHVLFSIFAAGIVLASGPALWLKAFSGAVSAAIFISLVVYVWLLFSKKSS